MFFSTASGCADSTDESSPQTLSADNSNKSSAWLRSTSRQKLYRAEIMNDYSTVPAGTMHAWHFKVMLLDGTPLTPQQFAISGTMPGHGHGMTTFPMTEALEEPGHMQVKGMKFHMSGKWTLHVNIVGPVGTDYMEFSVNIAPPFVAKKAHAFNPEELALLKSISYATLPTFKGDPSNRFSGNPEAIALGKALFFDPGLSANGQVSCATCHQEKHFFADNLVKSKGTATTPRHAPSLIGAAHSNWFYWDGRRDSLWSQALSPIETLGEMDSTRVDAVRYVVNHSNFGPKFTKLTGFDAGFLNGVSNEPGIGPLSSEQGQRLWQKVRPPQQERINHAFASVGKMLAAFEETLLPSPSRFDQYVEALFDSKISNAAKILTESEIRGAKLFIDTNKTDCMRCHNGPMLSNQEFHNVATAMSPSGKDLPPDPGRIVGLRQAQLDPFNCSGLFSDASVGQCMTLNNVRKGHLDNGAFKTPTLRNIAGTAPYMHHGEFASLEVVMHHYRFPPDGPPDSHEIPALTLDESETRDLIAFLKTL